MYNELALILGTDISVPSLGLAMHQPTLAEIAMIGEDRFFSACRFLNLSKEEDLSEEDKTLLEEQSNFDIIMSIINDKSDIVARQNKVNVMLLLTLIFPTYQIEIKKDYLLLKLQEEDDILEENFRSINKNNYEIFLKNFNMISCASDFWASTTTDYRAANDAAQKLIDKFKDREKKLAQLKGEESGDKVAVLSRYISILAVGEQRDLNSFKKYTVFQLMDEYKRYELKVSNDIYLKAQLAGATGMDEVDNWMKDIHPESK